MAFDPLFNLGGKVAVITGGSGILCSAIAVRMQTEASGWPCSVVPSPVWNQWPQSSLPAGKVLVLQADVLDQPALEIARAACSTCGPN
jgi:NAD(P)-dependent dehydrogenase (short-subunit alcohol dehydrogenase family)